MRPEVIIYTDRFGRRTSGAFLRNEIRSLGHSCLRASPARVSRLATSLGSVRLVVNAGVSAPPGFAIPDSAVVLNDPDTIRRSAHKRRMFEAFAAEDVPTLGWTRDRAVAQSWIDEGAYVMARTILQGSQGRGIVISPPDDLPDCRLYTKMFRGRNTREYRAYVVGSNVIDIVQKRRFNRERLVAMGIDPDDEYGFRVKSHRNGWSFCRDASDATEAERVGIIALAHRAADAVGLRYGAVDILTDRPRNMELQRMVVVETNTAPNMASSPTTRRRVAEAIVQEIGG